MLVSQHPVTAQVINELMADFSTEPIHRSVVSPKALRTLPSRNYSTVNSIIWKRNHGAVGFLSHKVIVSRYIVLEYFEAVPGAPSVRVRPDLPLLVIQGRTERRESTHGGVVRGFSVHFDVPVPNILVLTAHV